jgi:Phosphate-selective porin O and P
LKKGEAMLRNLATGSSRPRRLLLPLLVLSILLVPTFAHAQVTVKVNDDVSFRVGAQLQLWGDMAQDAVTNEYNQNLFVRRARVLLTGSVMKDVTFFIQTDNPNIGKAPKALTTGFVLQDAWAEWKISDQFMLDGGLMLVPLSREELTSTTSFQTIDISPTATVFATPTQTSATRDTGFQGKGYLADGRLEYRLGVFQGVRVAATTTTAASRNTFLHAAYVQYDFFEKERGYVFAGTNRGTRKILALSAGYDGQKDYRAYSANLHATIPVMNKNEVAALVQLQHYDGGKFLTAIPRQNDYLGEFDYYIAPSKIQPFVKYEDQSFGVSSNPSKDVKRYAGGFNYYVNGQNLKFTGQLTRVIPDNSAIRSTNEFTIQMQVWYY